MASIEIPDEVYRMLQEDAGDTPVPLHAAHLLLTILRNKPKRIIAASPDAFLAEIGRWGQAASHATLYGHAGPSFKRLPSGKVEVSIGAFFQVVGHETRVKHVMGELSERFGQDTQGYGLNLALASLCFGPSWLDLERTLARRKEPPLDPGDYLVIEKSRQLRDKLEGALAKLGVSPIDRLTPG